MLKSLLLAAAMLTALPVACDAGCCPRTPVRTAIAAVVEHQPVRSFFREHQPVRKTLRGVGRVLLGRCGGC